MMTQAAFIENGGLICPVCKVESGYITVTGELTSAGSYCFEDCKCDQCGARWTTEYKIAGYGEVSNIPTCE